MMMRVLENIGFVIFKWVSIRISKNFKGNRQAFVWLDIHPRQKWNSLALFYENTISEKLCLKGCRK